VPAWERARVLALPSLEEAVGAGEEAAAPAAVPVRGCCCRPGMTLGSQSTPGPTLRRREE
jgi:hypothetical protein